jgi:hypothetical protein
MASALREVEILSVGGDIPAGYVATKQNSTLKFIIAKAVAQELRWLDDKELLVGIIDDQVAGLVARDQNSTRGVDVEVHGDIGARFRGGGECGRDGKQLTRFQRFHLRGRD